MYRGQVGVPPPPMYPPRRPSDNNNMLLVIVILCVLGALYYYNYVMRGTDAGSNTDNTNPNTNTNPNYPPASSPPTCASDPVGYYYYNSPDVKNSGMDARQHWVTIGYKESRPSCWEKPREHTDRLDSTGGSGFSSLKEGEMVYSANRKYYLTMGFDGEISLVDNKSGQTKWKAGTSNKGTAGTRALVLQNTDGHLVLYSSEGAIWSTNVTTSPTMGPFILVVGDDGSLRQYGKNNWQMWRPI